MVIVKDESEKNNFQKTKLWKQANKNMFMETIIKTNISMEGTKICSKRK